MRYHIRYRAPKHLANVIKHFPIQNVDRLVVASGLTLSSAPISKAGALALAKAGSGCQASTATSTNAKDSRRFPSGSRCLCSLISVRAKDSLLSLTVHLWRSGPQVRGAGPKFLLFPHHLLRSCACVYRAFPAKVRSALRMGSGFSIASSATCGPLCGWRSANQSA